jgi:hypothetical protein
MPYRFALCRLVVASGLATFAAAAPARAGDTGPVIAIPSRPGVPIVINGRDASYAVVEGDWGLARPGAVPVTVYGGAPIRPNSVYEPRNSYHPRYGRAPERGRNETEPPADRPLPPPAESFSRDWSSSSSDVQPPANRSNRPQSSNSSGSDNVPATITDPETFYQPDVVVSPSERRRRRNHH